MRKSLILFSCVMAAFAAEAQARDSIKTHTVQFSDLNIASSAGKAEFYKRVAKAAKKACYRAHDQPAWLAGSRDRRECMADATRQIIAQYDALRSQPPLGAVTSDPVETRTASIATEKSVTLNLDRVDLSQERDVNLVWKQINRAAERVCHSPGDKGLVGRREKAACMERARGTAYASLGGAERFAGLERPVRVAKAGDTGRSELWDWLITILK